MHVLKNKVYVTYALQDSAKHDDVAGPGNGFVDVFSTKGKLLVMLWAMLRDNRRFVDPAAASPPEDTAPKLTVSSVAAVALG